MNPWTVQASEFPGEASATDKLRFALNYAITAPSNHNTQPWLFRLHGDKVDLIADRLRALPVIDAHDRELTISCGAAIGMLRIALRGFGYDTGVELLPNKDEPDLLATVELEHRRDATVTEVKLRDAIVRRRTVRVRFEHLHPGHQTIATLILAAAREFIELRFFMSEAERASLADLICEADRLQFADPSFRRELASWMHARHGLHRDGMSLSSMGVPDLLTPISAFAVRTFDVGGRVGGRAASSAEIVEYTPALAVLATDRDGPEDWLLAGQALAHVLVVATAAGLSTGYLNQPIEMPGLRLRLAEMTAPHAYPQLILRFGYGPSISPASRRSVDEVVIAETGLTEL
jgi:hypothetical protein